MKVKVHTDILFWKDKKDIDKKERELIKNGDELDVTKKVYERIKDYVDLVEEKEKE